MPNPRHDRTYRRLFSHPRMVADLLRGYLDPAALRTLDLSTLVRCDGTYITRDLRERRSDLVWRVQSRQGPVYIYLLLEFQSTVDPYMAVRMLVYVGLLWQDLIAQKRLAEDGTLPPVLPIVLYNGDQPWTAPTTLRDLFGTGPAFLEKYQPLMKYLFLDENHLPTTGGRRLRNLAAAIFSLEQSNDLSHHQRVIASLRKWLRHQPEIKDALGSWYVHTVATSLPSLPIAHTMTLDEVDTMMATRIRQELDRQMAEQRATGTAEGMVKAILLLVEQGTLTETAARASIRSLMKAKTIPTSVGKAALARFG